MKRRPSSPKSISCHRTRGCGTEVSASARAQSGELCASGHLREPWPKATGITHLAPHANAHARRDSRAQRSRLDVLWAEYRYAQQVCLGLHQQVVHACTPIHQQALQLHGTTLIGARAWSQRSAIIDTARIPSLARAVALVRGAHTPETSRP